MIKFFYRKKGDGISIQKVFDLLIPYIQEDYDVEKTYLQYKGASIKSIIANMFYAWRKADKNCINHITGAVHYLSYVLPKNTTITTVHDLLMLDRAQSYSYLKRKIFYILWGKSLLLNRYIVCISEKTKSDLLKYINISEDKIQVIGDPVPDNYSYTPNTFNNINPIILHIGTKDNKNLENTIFALQGLNIHLRIIGKLTDSQRGLLNRYGIDYSNDFNVSEERMYQEYLNCDIVNFPSLYEGFGMPIIEAQAVGRVCLTSNIPPMDTVAGNGAILVDPHDVADMRAGYLKLINDSNLRENLIINGLDNVKKFRAQNIAKEYNKLYKEII